MEKLLQQYQTRLAQLNSGCEEFYEGERAIIQDIIRAYKKVLD